MSPRFVVVQERDALAKRKVIAIALGSIGVLAIAVAASSWMLDGFRAGRDIGPPAPSQAPMTLGTVEQGLFVGPPRGLDLRRDQRATLDRWGWVDRDAGLARIPIERAMDLVAAEGAKSADGGTR